jgi:hypothetical protein
MSQDQCHFSQIQTAPAHQDDRHGYRPRVARGIAKMETEASIQVFQTLKRRGHSHAPPPTMSDGWGGIDDAMVEVYGIVPQYTGVGRPPTLKQSQPGWQYLQAVKQRENGRVVGVELRVIHGDEEEVLALFGKSTAKELLTTTVPPNNT